VIVRAESVAVASPLMLLRMIRDAESRRLGLVVNRGGKVRNVTLRW
jgi:hypothetical protein